MLKTKIKKIKNIVIATIMTCIVVTHVSILALADTYITLGR